MKEFFQQKPQKSKVYLSSRELKIESVERNFHFVKLELTEQVLTKYFFKRNFIRLGSLSLTEIRIFRQKIQILYSRLFFKLRSDSACHHVFYFTYIQLKMLTVDREVMIIEISVQNK